MDWTLEKKNIIYIPVDIKGVFYIHKCRTHHLSILDAVVPLNPTSMIDENAVQLPPPPPQNKRVCVTKQDSCCYFQNYMYASTVDNSKLLLGVRSVRSQTEPTVHPVSYFSVYRKRRNAEHS